MVIFGQVRESTLGISDSPPKKEMMCVHIIFFLGNLFVWVLFVAHIIVIIGIKKVIVKNSEKNALGVRN